MKNILFILSMMISAVVFARTTEELKIQDVRMQKQKENLIVSFTLEVPQHAVRNKYKQSLVPVIYNEEKEMVLPGIEVVGKNKARREKQERLLTGATAQALDGISIRNGDVVAYETTVPYAAWMDTLSLRIDRIEQGCCKENMLTGLSLAEGVRMNPKPQPIPTPPVIPAPKQQVTEKNFAVYFHFNQANIDTTFMDNKKTLSDVLAFLKQSDIKGSGIKIAGYASPEGNEAWNEKLAYKRAKALENHLIDNGWAKHDSVTIIRHAINWEGLRTLVNSSDMPYKADVLNILNNTTDVEATNRKLRQLQGGEPYRYLTAKIYPRLRVASFGITNFNN